MKNNKKWIGFGIGLACLVLCLVLLLSMCSGRGEKEPDGTGQTTDPAQTTASTEQTEETSEPTEETSEATEPTEEDTEPTEESTEPTTGGGSGGSSVGNFTGGSTSSGSSGVTEDTGSETEPTEEIITVSDPGTEENPYAESLVEFPAAVSTVKIPAGGEISYYLYHAAGSVLTVEDGDVYILYNGATYSPVDGVVTVRLEQNESDMPVSLAVGSKSASEKAYTLNFAEPVGKASNPQILESLDQLLVSLEKGNEDGYFFTWTATGAGTVTFKPDTVVPEDVKYDIIVTLGDTVLRLSDREDGSVSTEVEKDDVLTVQVVTLPDENGEYPAAEITISASFTEKEIDCYILEDGVTQTLTVPAGGMIRVQADATGKIMDLTVDGGRMYYDWYVQLGDTQGTPTASGIYVTQISGDVVTAEIHNNDTENPAVLDVTAASCVTGTLENPLEAVIGGNTAVLAAGSDGCYYSWSAEENGTLTLSISGENTVGWQFCMSNISAGIYGDTHWSDDDPLVSSESVQVSAGNQVQIWINTYDPADMFLPPKGEVTFTLTFTAEDDGDRQGTQTNPYILEDGVSQTLTVPAGGVIWVQADATGKTMDLTVDGSRMYYEWYVQIGTELGTPSAAGVYRSELSNAVYLFPIYNTSEETDAVLVVSAVSPVPGSAEYPLVIGELGRYQASVSEGGEGVYYTWTALEDGTLTVSIDTDAATVGWMYFVNNETGAAYGDTHWSDDDPLVCSQDVAVSAGDVVTIWVSTYDPANPTVAPEGEVAFSLSFTVPGEGGEEDPEEPEVGTETNPYILEDGVTYSLTLPANGVIWVQVDATMDVMTLTVDGGRQYFDWYVLIDQAQGVPGVSGAYASALSGGVFVLPIYSTSADMDAVLQVTASSPVFGTVDNPEVIGQMGDFSAELEENNEGYYYTWTATKDGFLTVTIDTENTATGWQFFVNNISSGIFGDRHWSDDEPLVTSEKIAVSEGDVVEIWVGTYDPESYTAPAGTVAFTLHFDVPEGVEDPLGSDTNPYILEPGNSYSLTIPAESEIYVQFDASEELYLSLASERNYYGWYVTIDGTQYTHFRNMTYGTELASGTGYLLPIGNTMESEIVLEVTLSTLASLTGTYEFPEELEELGELTAQVEKGDNGYYFTWIAEKNGTLTLTIDTENCAEETGWQYSIYDVTDSRTTAIHTSGDDPLVPSDSLTVKEGDEIQIWVGTYNPDNGQDLPAGEVPFKLTFTLAVDTSAPQGSIYNPYVFVDGDSKNLTIPAGETVYIRVDATTALMELNLSGNRMYYDWTVTVDGTAYGPYANGARSVELQGDSYLIPITNTSDESQQVLTVTLNTLASLMGTLEHPQVLTELGDISVMIEGGADTEYHYFYWTATTSGTLRLTVDTDKCENGWQYSISNITRSRVTDKHVSSDETPVPSDSIAFTEGDLIQIWVCTYNAEDPFVPPAGMLYFSLSLE